MAHIRIPISPSLNTPPYTVCFFFVAQERAICTLTCDKVGFNYIMDCNRKRKAIYKYFQAAVRHPYDYPQLYDLLHKNLHPETSRTPVVVEEREEFQRFKVEDLTHIYHLLQILWFRVESLEKHGSARIKALERRVEQLVSDVTRLSTTTTTTNKNQPISHKKMTYCI